MPKSFFESFKEWISDDRYEIGEDIGCEFANYLETDPTSVDCSSTPQQNGSENPE